MKKNRRTLKKRIRKILFLTSIIIIISWGMICLFLIEGIIHGVSFFVTNYISEFIGENVINKNVDIDEYVEDFRTRDFYSVSKKIIMKNSIAREIKNIASLKDFAIEDIKFPMNMDYVLIDVDVNDDIIFSNSLKQEEMHPIIKKIAKRYENTESRYTISDSKGTIKGNVTVKINPNLIFIILVFLSSIILVCMIIFLIIVSIVSRIFTIPIISPLKQLEKKMRSVSQEDFDQSKDIEIELKKPLREIQELASATTLITNKMKKYNDLISENKKELENQNLELETQNIELFKSKQLIQETQTQLIESEKMASIGQLTAAITHEINTPLGTISSNVQLLEMLLNIISAKEVTDSDTELNDIIIQIKQANDINIMACKRVKEIIKSLKNFAKLDGAEFHKTNINENIDSVLVLTSYLWKNSITLHKEYSAIPMINCFPVLLNQVFMNVIVNAIHSIEKQGEIYIKTYNDSENIYVSIKDTGKGIKKEMLDKIFDFGFTTKNGGNGMGVGLSISYDIIQKHKGDIKIISEEGKGTEFLISIPILS